MYRKLYGCDILLKGMAQDFEHMAAALRPFIQQAHAIGYQRHLARHRHLAPDDQTDIRDGVVGRDIGAWSHSRRGSEDVFLPTAQQAKVWDTPTLGFTLHPKPSAMGLEPFSRRLPRIKISAACHTRRS
jgi:hypothetical protein